jgi:hypothetical protein
MIRVARMATALLAVVLVRAQAGNKDWRKAIVQEVQRQENRVQTWADYTDVLKMKFLRKASSPVEPMIG